MKYLFLIICLPIIFSCCNGKNRQNKNEGIKEVPDQQPVVKNETVIEQDAQQFIADSLDYDNEEEGEIEEERSDFPKDIIPENNLIVRIDTLSDHANYILQKIVEDISPQGVVTRFIYPKEARSDLIERGNEFRNFTGSSTTALESFDWDTSEEPFVIKNNLGTYLINPHKKPVYGFVIATMNSAPVLYEGENLNGVDLVKSYFNIKTKDEFKKITSENVKEKRKWIAKYHEQLYKERFTESNHNFKTEQIKFLNRYILDYQLGLKDIFAMPSRTDIYSFKGKVKRVNYKFRSAYTRLDTTYVSIEYDKKSNLVRYTKYDMSRSNDKTIYKFVYSNDGLLETVLSNDDNVEYKVYSYNDRIILARYPFRYDYSTKIPEMYTMFLTEEGLPKEIERRHKEEKTILDNAKLMFNKDKNLIYYDNGMKQQVYNVKQYEYKGDKLSKVIMKQYVEDGSYDLIYEYYKDKVVMKSKKGTYIQKLTYDKKDNILSAVFDERAGIFETTSYFYEYEYY